MDSAGFVGIGQIYQRLLGIGVAYFLAAEFFHASSRAFPTLNPLPHLFDFRGIAHVFVRVLLIDNLISHQAYQFYREGKVCQY